MSCSMMTMVSTRRSFWLSSARRAVPWAPSPAVGSSKDRMRGPAATPAPISSARRSPYDSRPAGIRSLPPRPTRASTVAARSRAPVSRRRSCTMLNDRVRTAGAARRTFSSAEYSSKTFISWNDRATPRRAIAYGGRPVMSSPPRTTLPRSGRTPPVSTLKHVVLPAPFGPMMPLNRPSGKARLMSSRTTWSPKRLCRPRASSSATLFTRRRLQRPGPRAAMRGVAGHGLLPEAGQPLRLEHDDEHEHQSEPQQPRLGVGAEEIAREEIHDGADHRPPEADEAAADERHEHHHAGPLQAHDLHVSPVLGHREEPAGQPRHRAREREARPLVDVDAVPEVGHARLVLLDRAEHLAERRVYQPPQEGGGHDEHREDEVRHGEVAGEIEGHHAEPGGQPRDVQQAILAAGDRRPFAGDEEEHLPEGDRHQGKVDAAPVRDEERDAAAHDRRRQHRRQQPDPQIGDEMELREPHGVGADAEVRAVAEGRQPRVAEEEIEAEREEAPDQDLDAEIAVETDVLDPERQGAEHREGHQHTGRKPPGRQRAGLVADRHRSSTLFLPSRPRPRTVTTSTSSTYIETSDHAVAKAPVRPTTMPISSPAMTAPQKLPTPPRTMMTKAGTTASTPTCGRTPQMGAITMPATAASPVPKAKTRRRSRVRFTPRARTISLSWAPALMSAPYRVRWRNSHRSKIMPTAKAEAKNRYTE